MVATVLAILAIMDRDWSLSEWDNWWKSTGARPDEETVDSSHHHHGDEFEGEDDCYAPRVSDMLKKHRRFVFEEGQSNRVFLTFCGNSLDLKWLAQEGQEVVGNDFSAYALEGFLKEHGLEYDTSTVDPFTVYKVRSTHLTLFAGDFYKIYADICGGKFDAIWDTGSFQSCAVSDRKTYARTAASLMKLKCNYLLSITDFGHKRTWKGPPYLITDEIVEETFGDCMSWKLLDQGAWGPYTERIILLQLKD